MRTAGIASKRSTSGGRGLLRRKLATVVATLTLGATIGLIAPAQAHAGGCIGTICGKVNNNTRFWMRTTESWNSGPDRCREAFGGGLYPCYQNPLGPTLLRGGNGVDVDAFTYPYDDFYWDGYLITRGEWIRIHDGSSIYCSASLSESRPRCS